MTVEDHYTSIAEGCVECGLCRKNCLFLQQYGEPKVIADHALQGKELLRESFECSLCTLCTAVCPKDIDPAAMFAAMRRRGKAAGLGEFREHKALLAYERWGVSSLFSWYGLPKGCDTVFFPGCALAGSRAERVIQVYSLLKKQDHSLGLVLDCCTKPSHDLGRFNFFNRSFGFVQEALAGAGIKKVLVSCPSCYRVWRDYGGSIEVQSVYEKLALNRPLNRLDHQPTITVHDPCPTRNNTEMHAAVRNLVESMGIRLREMKHHGVKTLCCGEGGAACYIVPEYAGNWTALRAEEAEGDHIITYCAGCTHFLSRLTRTDHILDLICAPEQTLSGKTAVTRSPFTWMKRFFLKSKVNKLVLPTLTGKRDRRLKVVLR